jgi:hypothetical protein
MLTYVVVSGMLPAAFGKGSVNSGFWFILGIAVMFLTVAISAFA